MIFVLETSDDRAALAGLQLRLARLGLVARGLSDARPGLLSLEASRPGEPAQPGALSAEQVEAVAREIRLLPGVERFVSTTSKHPLASREFHPESSIITVRREGFPSVSFGGRDVPVLAGPCSVESQEQVLSVARAARAAGATVLRGGAFKPRSSPYAFQGLGLRGLELLAIAREETRLLVVTEALDRESLDLVALHADIVQIGTRNMSNFSLLRAAGRCGKPVLLKRGFSSTLEEWLLAAEYVLASGNPDVILCERGVRTFGDHARFVMDLNIIPAVKAVSHLPVIADPSHGTGRADCVEPLARASVAVGADGVMLEVHPDPSVALSDGPQALLPERLAPLLRQLDAIAAAIDRRVLVGAAVSGVPAPGVQAAT